MEGDELSVRKRIRDKVVSARLMQRMVRDIQEVMETAEEDAYVDADLFLWSDLQVAPAGINWGLRG
ncbi:hypothetical protein ACTOVQ_00010 [Arcanobacterium canis]